MDTTKQQQKRERLERKKQIKQKEYQRMGTIYSYSFTTDKYWDCECEKDYIHPKSQDICSRCGVNKDEMPDSRVDEVEALLGKCIIWK